VSGLVRRVNIWLYEEDFVDVGVDIDVNKDQVSRIATRQFRPEFGFNATMQERRSRLWCPLPSQAVALKIIIVEIDASRIECLQMLWVVQGTNACTRCSECQPSVVWRRRCLRQNPSPTIASECGCF